jgi:alpha-glucosidase (family GH31 glycosyl hydrolase)
MFGDSLLIGATYPNFHQAKIYLPPSADWYNFYTSERMIPTSNVRTIKMESEEIGVYIKAGSIIARKYTRRMSALQTLNDNYMLDIYPTLEGVRTAKGMLYMDDGETFDERHTIIHFTYEDGKFKITNSHNTYTQG